MATQQLPSPEQQVFESFRQIALVITRARGQSPRRGRGRRARRAGDSAPELFSRPMMRVLPASEITDAALCDDAANAPVRPAVQARSVVETRPARPSPAPTEQDVDEVCRLLTLQAAKLRRLLAAQRAELRREFSAPCDPQAEEMDPERWDGLS